MPASTGSAVALPVQPWMVGEDLHARANDEKHEKEVQKVQQPQPPGEVGRDGKSGRRNARIAHQKFLNRRKFP